MVGTAPRPFRVLLTRPVEESKRIVPDLVALGGEVILSPLIKIEPLPLPATLPKFEAVIVTSENAIQAVEHFNIQAPVYCVGDRTATVLGQKGCDVKKWYATGEHLLADLQATQTVYLYFSGVHKSIDLSEALPHCVTIDVYHAQALEQLSVECIAAFKAEEIDWVLIYSQRSAEILGQHLRKFQVRLKRTNVMAISPKAAEPLKQLGFKTVCSALTPDHQGMLTSLRTSLENEGVFYG